MRTLASLPIVAAVPSAVTALAMPAQPPSLQPPAGDDPVIEIAARVTAAWVDYEEKSRVHSRVDGRVIDWRRKNPEPDLPSSKAVWEKAYQAAKTKTGYRRAERVSQQASDFFDEVRDELRDTRPTSLAGLRAKAGAARATQDEELEQQLVYDIGVLFGDLDQNERPIVA